MMNADPMTVLMHAHCDDGTGNACTSVTGTGQGGSMSTYFTHDGTLVSVTRAVLSAVIIAGAVVGTWSH